MHHRHISVRLLRQSHCADSSVNPACLPPALEEADPERLDDIIERSRILPRGGILFHQGAPFNAVYAARSGAIKTCGLTLNGDERVAGFYLPGEIVGLDSSGNPDNCYRGRAVALETTAVCAIPCAALVRSAPEPVQALRDPVPDFLLVFADAAREHEDIQPLQSPR